MDVPQLSTGALLQALHSENFAHCPITLQVLEVQLLTPKDGNAAKRARLTVSDGVSKCPALLASQLKSLVDDGTLVQGSIVEVLELVGNKKLQSTATGGNLQGKKLLIFLNMTIRGHYPNTIGNPVAIAANEENQAPANGMAPQQGGFAGQNNGPAPMQQGGGGMYGNPAPYGAAPYGGGGNNGGPGAYGPPGGMQGGPPMQQQQRQGGMYGGNMQPNGGNMQQNGGAGPRPFGGAQPAFGGGAAGGAGPSRAPGGAGYGVGGGSVARDDNPAHIIPIKALNPYQGRWTIKARCTQKSEVRRWSNARGEGKIMSFDLLDKEGGEIKVTAWNDVVDTYQEVVQVGQIYMVSKGSLKPKNARFNNTSHEFEIYLERSSVVQHCPEDAETALIPAVQYNFKKLAELEMLEANTIVDVVGIVDSCADWQLITKKDGTDTRKRSLTIRDDSGRSIEVTLWGEFTTNPGDAIEAAVRAGNHPVLAVKAGRIGDFNGKNISSVSSTIINLEPDVPEAGYLRNWYDFQGGNSTTAAPLSEGRGAGGGRVDRRVTFSMIKDEALGTHGNADWVAINGTVQFIRNENMSYNACTRDFNGRACQKKLQEQGGENEWWCERCSAPCAEPAVRYLLNLQAQDHTGNQWITAFGDTGEAIMGVSAAALRDADPQQFEQIIQDNTFKSCLFKLKVVQDTYGDEQKIKVSVSKVQPLDFVAESRLFIDYIRKMEAGQPIMQAPEAGPAAHNGPGNAYGGAAAGNAWHGGNRGGGGGGGNVGSGFGGQGMQSTGGNMGGPPMGGGASAYNNPYGGGGNNNMGGNGYGGNMAGGINNNGMSSNNGGNMYGGGGGGGGGGGYGANPYGAGGRGGMGMQQQPQQQQQQQQYGGGPQQPMYGQQQQGQQQPPAGGGAPFAAGWA